MGDPKQSIYGWRGGASGVDSRGGSAVPQLARGLWPELSISPVLMDFVNKTFDALQDHAEAIDPEPVVPELPAIPYHTLANESRIAGCPSSV